MDAGSTAREEIDALQRRVSDAEVDDRFRLLASCLHLRHEARRDRRAALAREALDLLAVRDRHDAGDDRHVDARSPRAADESEVRFGVEEQLLYKDRRAGAALRGECANTGGCVEP